MQRGGENGGEKIVHAASEGENCEVRVADDSSVVGGGVGRQERFSKRSQLDREVLELGVEGVSGGVRVVGGGLGRSRRGIIGGGLGCRVDGGCCAAGGG